MEPQIQQVLVMLLQWWAGDSNMDAMRFTEPIQWSLNQQFHLLGWDQFVQGHIGTEWAALQLEYFANLKVWYTSQKWASPLITAVWNFSCSLWDNRNYIPHHVDVHSNELLDMDAVDMAIIAEEWHEGSEDLIPMDAILRFGTGSSTCQVLLLLTRLALLHTDGMHSSSNSGWREWGKLMEY
jgi:uncharacterized membrane protein